MALAISPCGSGFGFVHDSSADAGLIEEVRGARVASFAGLDLWDLPFTVVDIETTGAVAARDGITEIALVAVASGRVTRRWSTFVDPAQPIPPFISRLTGITDDMVAGAPAIGEVLPAIEEFVGDSILVGHNVRFDAHFIDAELVRHGRRALSNIRLDTLVLARRTIAEVPNYKLGTLTRELGIDVERHHRALADADATAELLIHCIKKLEDNAVFTLGTLLDHLRVRAKRPRPYRPRRAPDACQLPVWTSVLRSELDEVPSKPGVYTLRDAGDRVVYVGKSRCLRQRLRVYATAAAPAGPKVRALRASVASFSYTVTGSELEALLMEAELVRAHNPPFNERLRHFQRFGFIKVEPGERGRLLTTTRLCGDGARYYGPYRSMSVARSAVAALQDALGLGAGGEEGEASSLPPAERAALIDAAMALIEGSADDVLLSVARRRDEAAARGKAELAAREEVRLDRLRALRCRHALLTAATDLHAVVFADADRPGEEACFVFCAGRLAARGRLPRRLPERGRAVDTLAKMLESFTPGSTPRCYVKQHEIDQLYIFAGWYEKRMEGLYYAPLPDRQPEAGEALRWARQILDGEPVT